MELIEAVKARKSIRGYKPTPTPKEVLNQVLEIATLSPSAMNVQPWKFTILGGKVIEEAKEALQKQFLEGVEPHPEFAISPRLEGVYKGRQVDLGRSIFQLMDIEREDKGKRTEWTLKMLRFFDAPNAIIISVDEEVSSFLFLFSLGVISQTIALAAVNLGLGTCIEQAPVFYPEVIRRIIDIPESQKLAIAIAIGYPDWDFPANKLQCPREPVSNIATWQGFA